MTQGTTMFGLYFLIFFQILLVIIFIVNVYYTSQIASTKSSYTGLYIACILCMFLTVISTVITMYIVYTESDIQSEISNSTNKLTKVETLLSNPDREKVSMLSKKLRQIADSQKMMTPQMNTENQERDTEEADTENIIEPTDVTEPIQETSNETKELEAKIEELSNEIESLKETHTDFVIPPDANDEPVVSSDYYRPPQTDKTTPSAKQEEYLDRNEPYKPKHISKKNKWPNGDTTPNSSFLERILMGR